MIQSWSLWSLIAAALLLAVTLLRPTLPLARADYRYVFVLDITQSMNVADSTAGDSPPSRLDYAKQAVSQALGELPCGSEAGLALFTAHRVLLLFTPVEVCTHLHELRSDLAGINSRLAWAARSEVAKGLYDSLVMAKQLAADTDDDDKRDGAIHTRLVFISDGHEAPPIHPNYRPKFNKGTPGDVQGLIVGVGGSVPVPIPKFDAEGKLAGYWQADEVLQVDTYSLGRFSTSQPGEAMAGVDSGDLDARIKAGTEHLSMLREAYLMQLAEETELHYLRLDQPRRLTERLLAGDFSETTTAEVDIRWLLGLAALLLLLAPSAAAVINKG